MQNIPTLKISVVVPTRGRPELIVRCVEALLDQDLPRDQYEIIVVTDGPDPATVECLKKNAMSRSVRWYSLDRPAGPAAARNKGWRAAKGRLVAFTDDDCLPARGWLKAFISADNGLPRLAFSGKVMVPIQGRPTDHALNTLGLEQADFVTANCCVSQGALVVIGGFDERFKLAWREDTDLQFGLMRHGVPVCRVASALVVHPVRSARWGSSLQDQKKGLYNALLYKKYPGWYRKYIQEYFPADYLLIVASGLFFCYSMAFQKKQTALLGIVIWSVFTAKLIYRRLKKTSHTPLHAIEMVLTSMAIPFLSVYWQLFGAIKFKVLFI